jgi:alpha-D-ribose 1-methylphosphonate 5-triphosphate synthase subunit PhnG
VDTLVQAANYSYTRSGFDALRRRLTGAGAVFVAGIVVFAYAANPPKPAAGTATGHAAVQGSPAPKAAAASPAPAASIPGRQPGPGRL